MSDEARNVRIELPDGSEMIPVLVRSNFLDIVELHKKFDLPIGDVPHLLDMRHHDGSCVTEFLFRYRFLKEELAEFFDAHTSGDLGKAADALIDMVVVAMGTAVMMGLPWEELWDDVHRANMSKVRGRTSRGVDFDLVKPADWVPPRSDEIILNATERAIAQTNDS